MKNKAFPETLPEKLARELLREFPQLDEFINIFFTESIDAKWKWPDWCYLPMNASITFAKDSKLSSSHMESLNHFLKRLELLAAIIPWRVAKPIYQFDADCAYELMEKAYDVEKIPIDVLKHMPFPGIYIDHPPMEEGECDGIFFYLNYDPRLQNAVALRMLYIMNGGKEVVPVCRLVSETEGSNSFDAVNSVLRQFTNTLITNCASPNSAIPDIVNACYRAFPKHLSLLLYLCSENTDIIQKYDTPKRRGPRKEVAAHPDTYVAGTYIGNTIRRQRMESRRASSHPHGSHRSMRPHARRGHWHTYRMGKGRTETRIRWVSMVFVNRNKGQPDAAIHRVTG